MASGTLIVDQVTKWAIVEFVMRPGQRIAVLPFFNLVLGFNPGISFGMFRETLDDFPYAFSLVKLTIVGLLAWLLARSDDRWERVGFGLMIGGALGNVADRLRIGAVVDFLDFHIAGWHWPSFNLADAALSIGVMIMLLRSLRGNVTTESSARRS
ncbi:MAG: signal peptidase II [Alphaproteobacteria bacterium]|nr:signal peptidase II [Alphaproteobacteria bacterium]